MGSFNQMLDRYQPWPAVNLHDSTSPLNGDESSEEGFLWPMLQLKYENQKTIIVGRPASCTWLVSFSLWLTAEFIPISWPACRADFSGH
jgi:hypothetical protein